MFIGHPDWWTCLTFRPERALAATHTRPTVMQPEGRHHQHSTMELFPVTLISQMHSLRSPPLSSGHPPSSHAWGLPDAVKAGDISRPTWHPHTCSPNVRGYRCFMVGIGTYEIWESTEKFFSLPPLVHGLIEEVVAISDLYEHTRRDGAINLPGTYGLLGDALLSPLLQLLRLKAPNKALVQKAMVSYVLCAHPLYIWHCVSPQLTAATTIMSIYSAFTTNQTLV